MTQPFTPAVEQMEDTHYGITVCHIGEDGDMLALGHHSPRRALAAFNRHARVFVGVMNLEDSRGARIADWLGCIQERWAVFSSPDPSEGDDPDWLWAVDYSVAADTPGAVPIMLLQP